MERFTFIIALKTKSGQPRMLISGIEAGNLYRLCVYDLSLGHRSHLLHDRQGVLRASLMNVRQNPPSQRHFLHEEVFLRC